MATQILVNIGSGYDGNKPLPEPMLTYHKYAPAHKSLLKKETKD